jgi:epsilon-lactone hydrolase
MTENQITSLGAGMICKIDLERIDIEPGRKLRAHIAHFWSQPFLDARAKYDDFISTISAAASVTFRESHNEPAPGWWCDPICPLSDCVIIFIHGGGYGLGSATAYRNFASQIALRTNVRVFVLEYPLAPEAVLPEAVNLAVRTISRLRSRYKVAVVGDSAGGGLSLAPTANLIRRGEPVAAVVAFSPWADLTLSGDTMRSMAIGDISLDPEYLRHSALKYAGPNLLNHPDGSPLFGIPPDMPPVLIQVGTDEVLLDDAVRYARMASLAGNDIELEIWEGMHHVFQLNIAELATARHALSRASDFLTSHFATSSSPCLEQPEA